MEYQLTNSAIEIPKDKALQDLLRKLSNKKPEDLSVKSWNEYRI